MIWIFLSLLYRRVPAPMLALVALQLVAVTLLPTDPFAWVLIWHQFGFAVMLGVRPTYTGAPGSVRLLYWVFREAMSWPLLVYRFCKQ